MTERIWNHNKLSFGGDYNPEQWSEDVWEEDMRMFHLAHIDMVTLNVFSWASLQSDEVTYHFEKLDKIMELVKKNGLKVCLSTATGAHPAWMAKKYPEILRTEYTGMKRKFGGRHNSCPNSLVYQKYSVLLAQKLAERYQNYDNIVAWHVSNEFGGECFCENCEKQFRVWLKERYHTLEALNQAWNTSFWGHTFYDWDEIVLPNALSEHFEYERTMFQGISLDYRRFSSDSMLNCYRMEYEAIKKITPDIPVTTNLMGFYKPLDYQKWAQYMDFASWDNYPSYSDSAARCAMNHDLVRGLKDGKSFILMEQTPSVTNWQPYNALKRPGELRLQSYQAVAHGSDSIMFFQMRRSIGACEKYHGAVIDHCGHENTRVFREITQIGEELEVIGDHFLGARGDAKVAIVFDWDNWWGIEYSAGPNIELKYLDEVEKYYTALHNQNIAADIIRVEADLAQYDVVIAPILYMTKGDYPEKIKEYVKKGGTFVTTYFSGYVNENDLVITGGYPGKLRELLGIWVEESDALPPEYCNYFMYEEKKYPCKILCDLLHLEGAKSLATYQEDFYAGMPVITENSYGAGKAYYVGTRSSAEFYDTFIERLCEKLEITPEAEVPAGIEAVNRVTDNHRYLFLLNHTGEEKQVAAAEDCKELITQKTYQKGDTILLGGKDVAILER